MTNDKRIIEIEVGKACIGGLLDTMTGSVILTASEAKGIERYIDQLNAENAKLRELITFYLGCLTKGHVNCDSCAFSGEDNCDHGRKVIESAKQVGIEVN